MATRPGDVSGGTGSNEPPRGLCSDRSPGIERQRGKSALPSLPWLAPTWSSLSRSDLARSLASEVRKLSVRDKKSK